MLKLIQSCSVFLSHNPLKLSQSNLFVLFDSSETVISRLQAVSSTHSPAFLSSAFYLSIFDDLMRKKSKSKKIKTKAADYAAKKGKSHHSWISRYKSSAGSHISVLTMSCEERSCSKVTKELKNALMTSSSRSDEDVAVLDSPNDDDVTILDSPVNNDVEVLYDSFSSSSNQTSANLKNKSETSIRRYERAESNSESSFRNQESKYRFYKNDSDRNSWRKWSPNHDSESSSSWRTYSPKSDSECFSWKNRFTRFDPGTSSWRTRTSPSSASDSESYPRRNLSADEIAETAKKGREKLEEIRSENFTKYGEELKNGKSSKHKHDGFAFRVLSWNILSQKLLEQHRYLYSRSIVASLDWEYRKTQIINEIKDSKADILCLQEVEEESFHRLSDLKDLGFKGIFKKRTHDKVDGCAIYYRSDKLRLKEVSFVEYYQPGVRLLDRDNIGIVAKFEPKSLQGTEFVVATTHLLYNPRRHDIKLVQMQLLLAEVERLSFSGAIRQNEQLVPVYYPCILTGDLNLLPETGVYNLITKGELRYDHLSSKNLADIDLSQHNYQTLPQFLLPPYLGITNKCQHDKVVSRRKLVRQTSDEELRLMQLYNSELRRRDFLSRDSDEKAEVTEEDLSNPNKTDSQSKYGSGVLSHNLKFKSVYAHEKDGKREATTHQDRWITVDYIFYSPVSSRNEETNLRLLSYQNLPSSEEARDHIDALPNLFCGSDHLPLVSSFFLISKS